MKKCIGIAAIALVGALGFRLYLAIKVPNDEPDDGRVYAQIGRNVLDHHCYSVEPEEPYTPTFIRVPGYPLFLAGIYKVFGEDNNRAVRIAQAVLSTLTCLIVGVIAWAWAPSCWSETRRRRALLLGIALGALCPFTAIYVSVILTETWATLLAAASVLAATLGIKSEARSRKMLWWMLAGLLGGTATLFRPDAAMFVGAAGVMMVMLYAGKALLGPTSSGVSAALSPVHERLRPLGGALVSGIAITLGFAIPLVPWTIRNARVFGRFQPIAPAGAGMPSEFGYDGYIAWLKTWVDDVRYTEIAEWPLDYAPIRIDKIPDFAYDSPEEKARVEALFTAYNNGADIQQAQDEADDSSNDSDSADAGDSTNVQPDQSDANQLSANKVHTGKEYNVQMTPELDSAFDEIARERITRHPFRYYVVKRTKRAISMWFDTHSQYYPFQGELFPLSGLDTDLHQQYWLPAFVLITLLYTAFGLMGGFVAWRHPDTRRWFFFLALIMIPRIAFLSTLENPEPRYVVELFAFVAAAGALAIASIEARPLRARLSGFVARLRQRAASPVSG
jgi:4-amino-4-deoxy-L-arabinose transferase-like glycosyltransferase